MLTEEKNTPKKTAPSKDIIKAKDQEIRNLKEKIVVLEVQLKDSKESKKKTPAETKVVMIADYNAHKKKMAALKEAQK